MYLSYYGLHEPPFSITPDPRFVHLSERHRDALAHLLFGIDKGGGGGFVQLTGEVGTGKTTLSRLLLEQLPEDARIALVLNPRQNAVELLETICEELHIDIEDKRGSSKSLVDALNAHLLDAYAKAQQQGGPRTLMRIEHLGDLPNEHPSGQKLDEVWLAKDIPSGFNSSIRGCFDVQRTDLVDFQNTGCTSTIFQLPPLESANYRTIDSTIVPYGWRYAQRHVETGSYFSSMVTSTEEVEKAFNGGTTTSVNLGIGGGEKDRYGLSANLSRNESFGRREGQMTTDGRMMSVHQSIATSHAIVLDPIYVRLNDCFIRRVLRMAPTALAPAYFEAEADPTKRQAGGDDADDCPETFQGPTAVPLSVGSFLDLYGTHFAYAITYGGQKERAAELLLAGRSAMPD